MEKHKLVAKMVRRIEYLLLQEVPKPECLSKQKAHAELIQEIKRDIAQELYPKGINLTLSINLDD